MILADDFSVELLPLLLFCVIIVVITSWNGKWLKNEWGKNNPIFKGI